MLKTIQTGIMVLVMAGLISCAANQQTIKSEESIMTPTATLTVMMTATATALPPKTITPTPTYQASVKKVVKPVSTKVSKATVSKIKAAPLVTAKRDHDQSDTGVVTDQQYQREPAATAQPTEVELVNAEGFSAENVMVGQLVWTPTPIPVVGAINRSSSQTGTKRSGLWIVLLFILLAIVALSMVIMKRQRSNQRSDWAAPTSFEQPRDQNEITMETPTEPEQEQNFAHPDRTDKQSRLSEPMATTDEITPEPISEQEAELLSSQPDKQAVEAGATVTAAKEQLEEPAAKRSQPEAQAKLEKTEPTPALAEKEEVVLKAPVIAAEDEKNKAKKAAKRTVKKVAKKVSKRTTSKSTSTKKAASADRQSSDRAAQKKVKKAAAKKVTKKVTGQATKKSTKQAVKTSTKKASAKVGKKASQRTKVASKKVVKKVVKRMVKKTVSKSQPDNIISFEERKRNSG